MKQFMDPHEKKHMRQREMRELKDADFTSIPLDEPAFFEAATDDQGKCKTRHGPVKWSEFNEWLNLGGSYKFPEISEAVKKHRFSLRLIHIPLGKSWDRVNMSRENWNDLQSAFELHGSTVEAVVDLTGAFGFYTYRAADSSRAVERIKIVIKVANKITIGYDALSLVFDLKTMTIRAMIHGLMPPQWSELLGQLCNAPHLCCHPLFLPVLVFVNHRRHIERYRAHIDKSILELEQETGFGASGFLVTAYNAASARRDFVIESALVRLQSQQTELATIASVSRYSERLADFLADAMTKLDGALRLPEHAAIIGAEDEVAHLLELARSQAHSVASVVQALKERVQSQTNLPDIVGRKQNQPTGGRGERQGGHPESRHLIFFDSALKHVVLTKKWRNARFIKEPGRGLPGGKLDEYATDLERLARKNPNFAARWGTCFHRHAVHTEMQRNARWWPHLPLKLRPAPRSPTPEHFRRPLIEPPKVSEPTADTDAPTVAGQRQAEGASRPLVNPPNVSKPNSDSRTPVVAVPRRAEAPRRPLIEPPKVLEPEPDSDTPIVIRPRQSGRGRPREESCIVVNTGPYRRNLPQGNELGKPTLSSRSDERSGQASIELPEAPEPNADQAKVRGLRARRGRPSTSHGAPRGTKREQPRLPSQPTAPSSRKRTRDSSHGRRDDPADGTTASRAIVLGSSPPPQTASDSASATTSSGGSWCDF